VLGFRDFLRCWSYVWAPCRVRSHSLFFFFQAEDGIRDFHVTGVQTCALPISASSTSATTASRSRSTPHGSRSRWPRAACSRSRQIGRASCREKCRSRWGPSREQKKPQVVHLVKQRF